MNILINATYFVCVGIGYAIWADETIVAEVLVTGIRGVEVATVGINHASAFACPADRLIDEVPDKATLVFGIFADDVPVLLEATLRVTHGVSIFALNQRFGAVAVLTVLLTTAIATVHGTVDVGLACRSGLFILHGARGIHCLHTVIGRLEVGAIAGLIAQRPEDDARIVEVAGHVTLVAFDVSLQVRWVLGQGLLAIAHAVALHIGLGHQVDAVLVAQLVPLSVVGVVASAHGIDVQFLHDADILNHPFA